MNDDTLDQTTPIATLDNRVIDYGVVQNEVLRFILGLEWPPSSLFLLMWTTENDTILDSNSIHQLMNS